MQNIELNAGGFIGALVGGGLAAFIIFSLVGADNTGRKPYKLVIAGLIGGAFAGNALWAAVFKKPHSAPVDDKEPEE